MNAHDTTLRRAATIPAPTRRPARLLRRRRKLNRPAAWSSHRPAAATIIPAPWYARIEVWLVIIGVVFGVAGVSVGHVEPGFLLEVMK